MTNTDPFTACFVTPGDAPPDGMRVVWSDLGAINPKVSSRFALERAGRALIADEMGLGKTLQVPDFT